MKEALKLKDENLKSNFALTSQSHHIQVLRLEVFG